MYNVNFKKKEDTITCTFSKNGRPFFSFVSRVCLYLVRRKGVVFIFWKCGTLQRITHSARIIITMSIVYHSLIAKCVTTAYTSIEKRARVERKKNLNRF